MEFEREFIRAKVVARYKNLIVDVRLPDGELVPVFCPDENVMPNIYTRGADIWISRAENEERILRYEAEIVNRGEGMVMVNDRYNLKLLTEALKDKKIAEFVRYSKVRKINVFDKLPHVDLELSNAEGEKCYVCIAHVYNKQDGRIVFPSKTSFFEMEMYEELRRMRQAGYRTVLFVLAPRADCAEAQFVWNLNPSIAARIFDEAKNGLEFVCYGCKIDKKSITIENKLNIIC